MMLHSFPSTARDAYLRIRRWGTVICVGTLGAGILVSEARALAIDVSIDPETHYMKVSVSEGFDYEDRLYARLYWTWCFGEYQGSGQTVIPSWRANSMEHKEPVGDWGYAELWDQTPTAGMDSGTVSGFVLLGAELPWEWMRLDVYSDTGVRLRRG